MGQEDSYRYTETKPIPSYVVFSHGVGLCRLNTVTGETWICYDSTKWVKCQEPSDDEDGSAADIR
jgi:hypothetical protein